MSPVQDNSEYYLKKVDERLTIGLEYVDRDEDEVVCTLTFYNTSKNRLIINENQTPPDTANADPETNSNNGWLSGLWGGSKVEATPEIPQTNDVKLFLGYIQLFGYVVLNYKFGVDDTNSISVSDKAPRNSAWWLNKEYLETYADMGEDILERNIGLDSTPFIYDNLVDPMVIGGKLGGVNDLIVEPENESKLLIDSKSRYFLHDLIYNFNSYRPPKPSDNIENEGKLHLKELTDGILPFYTTSQSLLFSDLSLAPKSNKTFQIKFPNIREIPPTYNSRSTALTADQGLVSIKYSLILGFSKLNSTNNLSPIAIYYPFVVQPEKPLYDEKWFQPDYLQQITIDKSWHIDISGDVSPASSNGGDKNELNNNLQHSDVELKDTKENFLNDLDKLISSDLHNIPKMSTTERKKSFHSLYDLEGPKAGYIAQLPHHLKNQYQILVNTNQLCLVTISKPYYHLGEDVSFSINLNTETSDSFPTKVVGVTAHLEAHEIFHLKARKRFVNVYRVSQNVKLNSFAITMLNSEIKNEDQGESLLNGYLNIPKFLCQQFQSSKFMDLKYFLVFKFNLLQFDDNNTNENGIDITNNESETHENTTTDITASDITASDITADDSIDNDVTNGESEGLRLLENPDSNPHINQNQKGISDNYEFVNRYKFDNSGNNFTFRLPIVVLP